MSVVTRAVVALKAVRHLGLTQVALFALYKLGLKSGHYKRAERYPTESGWALTPLFGLPARETLQPILGAEGLRALRAQAEEIMAGKVRLFGGPPVDLRLTFDQPLHHWTAYEENPSLLSTFNLPHNDIKFLWEPARFGWAFTLGRDYHLHNNENSAAAFWRYTEQFIDANPPGSGPHWMNGQEVALRLMALVWAGQVFAPSAHSTPARMEKLAAAVAAHALRIPSTLLYARAQNNNHLLTEAAGLYTAGLALPQHPQAKQWRALGWKWLTWCFENQIDAYGEYVQHSANYHRLMLHTAAWVQALARKRGDALSPRARENLYAAAHWLYSLLDPVSGRVPNLGANDGANILPLSAQPFEDYRPVMQAAARAFMRYTLPPGAWDELSLWLGLPAHADHFETPRYIGDHLYTAQSWGYLRAVRLKNRPSHADQLHFDLWWRGLNIAQDAGTYLYNANPPWDNRLTATHVHNTVTVDGREQMTRAGRFLYLNWADGYAPLEENTLPHRRVARTYAYARRGIRHTRSVMVDDAGQWVVEDDLLDLRFGPHTYRLHWLLPDWEWALDESRQELRLKSPYGWVTVAIHLQPSTRQPASPQPANLQPAFTLVRAGEHVHGSGTPDPVRGWVSPTYGVKTPALSLACEVQSAQGVTFLTTFAFPD